jgi:hypothetical protein
MPDLAVLETVRVSGTVYSSALQPSFMIGGLTMAQP